MDTGGTMIAIHYSLAAMREYYLNVFTDQVSPTYAHHVTDIKTVEQSGYWVKYDSETTNYASVLNQGQLDQDDVSVEAVINTNKSYIIIKNNVRQNVNFDPAPNYLLQLKYSIDIIQYSTVKTNQT